MFYRKTTNEPELHASWLRKATYACVVATFIPVTVLIALLITSGGLSGIDTLGQLFNGPSIPLGSTLVAQSPSTPQVIHNHNRTLVASLPTSHSISNHHIYQHLRTSHSHLVIPFLNSPNNLLPPESVPVPVPVSTGTAQSSASSDEVVGNTFKALGSTTEQLTGALGQTVTQTGAALGQTTNNAVGAVGTLLTPTSPQIGGLLGDSGAALNTTLTQTGIGVGGVLTNLGQGLGGLLGANTSH